MFMTNRLTLYVNLKITKTNASNQKSNKKMNDNSIFGNDFYPTPREIVEKMLADFDVAGKIVLEPSAGTGNIVDVLLEKGAAEVLVCEINPKWQELLSAKEGVRIIGEDFLQVTPEDVASADLCVMNPPFSQQEKHILHAMDILPAGASLVSLCNGNFIGSSYYSRTTDQQRILEVIESDGYTMDYGRCFSTAERPTDVYVSCIFYNKPRSGEEEFADFFSYAPDDAELIGDGLQRYNLVRDYVNRYVEAVRRFDSVMAASDEINELTKPLSCSIKFGAFTENGKSGTKITRSRYKKDLQKAAWRRIFNEMNLRKFVTSGVQQQLDSFIDHQKDLPFTMRNVYRMIEMIIGTNGSRMKRCLEDAFDHICSFSAENSTAGEKWKTNANYMVNRRFIIPYICRYDTRWPSSTVKLSYYSNAKIDDIMKALCFLTGRNFDELESLDATVRNQPWGVWIQQWFKSGDKYEPAFFRVKAFKKGTMHFEFTDEEVWAKFNRTVAEIRGWNYVPQKSSTKSRKAA